MKNLPVIPLPDHLGEWIERKKESSGNSAASIIRSLMANALNGELVYICPSCNFGTPNSATASGVCGHIECKE